MGAIDAPITPANAPQTLPLKNPMKGRNDLVDFHALP
jgi:hypothetical protein